MLLNARSWGEVGEECVVCVHGLTQHGGVFTSLGERLARRGNAVIALDLRGHGRSGHEPPWNTERHVQDLLETVTSLGLTRVTWIGHSFGGRVVAAAAAVAEELTDALVLLDPGLQTRPQDALQAAEVGRLDWSFETSAGAVNALSNSHGALAPPHDAVAAYVEEDLRRGGDGRYRFSFCPSAVVVAWSEMCLPMPPVADVPTLVVCAEGTPFSVPQEERYRARLASRLALARVPNGHNVLWEAAEETLAAVEAFLQARRPGPAPVAEPTAGYRDAGGLLRPLL
jgi:lipase